MPVCLNPTDVFNAAWITLFAFGCLLVSLSLFISRVRPSRWKKSVAPPLGNAVSGVRYSFTGAMSPAKKESAYLHLPTYTAGLVFHIALFTALLLVAVIGFGIEPGRNASLILSMVLAAGALCGAGILAKRISSPLLRSLSNPDDYISNILVTGLLVSTALVLHSDGARNFHMIYASILLLYIPAGKLKHSFFFFSSRIALGIQFGRRGVWGSKTGAV